MFGVVSVMAIGIFLFVAINLFLSFRGGGMIGHVLKRAEKLQQEQREHELRLAEINARGRSPWTCTHCDSRNDSNAHECRGCGASREDDE